MPPCAASQRLQQQILRRRTAAHLVDVWLLELEVRDRHRPALAGTSGGQLQELAGAAAVHLVHTWSTSSCSSSRRDLRRPALAGTPRGQLQELAGAAATHLMHTRPSTALYGPSLHFLACHGGLPPCFAGPSRLRSSLAALLLMHYRQRPKTSPGAVFEAVL